MKKPPAKLSVRIVSDQYIRSRFNDGKYWERMQKGELKAVLKKSRHPSPPRGKFPTCTRSEILVYLDGGKAVAVVHQYLLPNGTLGASGKPDPKMLRLNGTILRVI